MFLTYRRWLWLSVAYGLLGGSTWRLKLHQMMFLFPSWRSQVWHICCRFLSSLLPSSVVKFPMSCLKSAFTACQCRMSVYCSLLLPLGAASAPAKQCHNSDCGPATAQHCWSWRTRRFCVLSTVRCSTILSIESSLQNPLHSCAGRAFAHHAASRRHLLVCPARLGINSHQPVRAWPHVLPPAAHAATG